MHLSQLTLLFALAATTTPLLMNADGYSDTPIIPGTKWHVHDPDRPKPPVIKPLGCITTKAPEDADVLFNGTKASLDNAWKALGNNPRMWPVERGVMVDSFNDIETKKSYGDCQLHLEWMAPKINKGPGQKDMNSGVFFHNRYEIQVLNTYKNETYADGYAGAIYGQFPPLANASLPKGEWQSYDIMFRGPRFDKDGKLLQKARVTIIHNGIVVQNSQEFLGATDHKRVGDYNAHPMKSPIKLQHHSDPVNFRNIWIRELKMDDIDAD